MARCNRLSVWKPIGAIATKGIFSAKGARRQNQLMMAKGTSSADGGSGRSLSRLLIELLENIKSNDIGKARSTLTQQRGAFIRDTDCFINNRIRPLMEQLDHSTSNFDNKKRLLEEVKSAVATIEPLKALEDREFNYNLPHIESKIKWIEEVYNFYDRLLSMQWLLDDENTFERMFEEFKAELTIKNLNATESSFEQVRVEVNRIKIELSLPVFAMQLKFIEKDKALINIEELAKIFVKSVNSVPCLRLTNGEFQVSASYRDQKNNQVILTSSEIADFEGLAKQIKVAMNAIKRVYREKIETKSHEDKKAALKMAQTYKTILVLSARSKDPQFKKLIESLFNEVEQKEIFPQKK